MDIGSVGRFGHYLRVATLSPEIFLHQTEVDIDVVCIGASKSGDCKIYRKRL
jgi:hypothetical protein